MKYLRLIVLLWPMSLTLHAVEDLPLNSPYKPRAPLDPKAAARSKTPQSAAEDRELNGEFRGLIHMGNKSYSQERWPGREMSDCRPNPAMPSSGCQVCQLQMGHAYGEYYFHPVNGRCTLQQLDVHFPSYDQETLHYLKRTAQQLFGGRAHELKKPTSKEPGWEGSGPGWRWNADGEIGYLYMDEEQASETGNGQIRFQWRRPPLANFSK